jgi:hypothetical protein
MDTREAALAERNRVLVVIREEYLRKDRDLPANITDFVNV